MQKLHHWPLKAVHPWVSKHYHYAVVGASANPEKFGNIIFFDLKNAGFMVTPVNPRLRELGGVKAVSRLQDMMPKPEVAIVVVPPDVGMKVIDDAVEAGVKKLWFQPGAESPELQKKTADAGLDAITDGSCIMVVRRQIER